MMNEESKRLLERLQTGWISSAGEISPNIRQGTLTEWKFVVGHKNRKPYLFGNTGLLTGRNKPWFELTAEVMFMDLRLALCDDDFVWWLE
jgi:hypothetical protein